MPLNEAIEILERLQTMRIQEKDAAYLCADYLSRIKIFLSSESTLTDSSPIDENYRESVIHWAYRVIDYLNFRRDTVESCVRFIDLFLSSEVSAAEEFLNDRKSFQLLSITSLYMAIKLNEPKRLSLDQMLPLGRGAFLKDDFVHMEAIILQVLDWRVFGPTASQYVELIYHFITLQDSMEDSDAVHLIFNDARYQIELGIVEYVLAPEMPSTIAMAAIHNACNRLPFAQYSSFDRKCFTKIISGISFLLQPESSLAQVQGRLCESILKNNAESSAHLVPCTDYEWVGSKKSRTPSPVSIVLRGSLS